MLLLSRKRFSKFLQRRLQKLSKNRFSDDFEKQTFLQPLHPKVEKNIDALFSHEMRRDRFVVDFDMHFLFILARSHLFSRSCFSQESGIICYNWMQNESLQSYYILTPLIPHTDVKLLSRNTTNKAFLVKMAVRHAARM